MLRFAWLSVLVAMMSGVAGCPGPSGTDSGVPEDDAPSSDAPAADAGDTGLDVGTDTGVPDAGLADAPTDASLTVTLSGAGMGTVTSAPTGIDCGATCTGTFAIGTSVVLTAAAETGSTFGGWGGACTGTSLTCTVTLSAATTVTAAFDVRQETITVTKAGTGNGVVSSTPAGIACGSDCAADFDYGTVVTLSASPAPGSTFAGWSGACTGTADCMVTLESAVDVTATFTLEVLTLSVTRAGTGAGSVTSAPAGITCGATCNADFDYGTLVTLTATATSGSTFSGWSGGCTGVGSCVVTLTAATSVTATFTLDRHDLMVSKLGGGAGTITSAPAGINCGATCTAAFDHGTPVTLTAAPAVGSTFVGWSGAGCSGTGTCTITMNAAESVSALFSLQSFTLSVGQSGGGAGTITSSVGGINCGASCATLLDFGTVVTLTATPAVSSTFAGWSGACTGLGTCTFTIGAATSVTAAFDLRPIAVTVTRTGTGTGTVTSSPAGINCGATCTAPFVAPTVVTLTAAAGAGSTFTGWSGGGCSGTGTCSVAMTSAQSVTATFTLSIVTITIAKTGLLAGSASVTSSPPGITCGATCSGSFAVGTVVTLTQAPGGSVFNGWSGAGCTGTGTCTFTVGAPTTVTAAYRGVRVAISAGAASCIRPESGARLTTLLAARGHTAVFATGAELDTLAEINLHDVIVTAGPGDSCAAPEASVYDSVIDTFIRTSGRGVVVTGWFLFLDQGAPNLVADLPVTLAPTYLIGPQTVTPVAGHPITSGVGSFSTLQWLPYGGGTRPGATSLLSVGGTSVAAAWTVGSGRSVFLGPMFMEGYAAYDNEGLLDGTQAAPIELMLRSIEWAARAR